MKERNLPEKGTNEVLLKIKKVGICGTDIHAYGGVQAFFTYPRILGHELAAEVIKPSDTSSKFSEGDKVVVMPYVSCGTCVACINGKSNCCTSMRVLGIHTDGGMQEIFSVPENLLLPANHLSFNEIAIVEPLAIGAHAIRRAGSLEGETILVIGCGPIGIAIMKFAKIAGAQVIAMDINEQRLAYVRNKIGVDYTVNAQNEAHRAIKAMTNQQMATAVFDASGNKKALETGIEFMAHGGRYVLVGLSKGNLSFNHPAIHAKESTIMCSRNATLEDFEYVMDVLSKGLFPVDSYITHSSHFTKMIEQFETWTQPESGVIKAVVEF
ncbi:zinc-binding alcohol dehydrogenase family protein [Fulvivirgaceae bacterium BMA10]|uniref:Zinc-binding alcohol dehydrogenase family protein n=1 Tax=Splendidivirga corallicola TaxID=3051826 RepID=A0ABT8KRJ5_9BACT|nr:zinc-binding alcohol dehydrogenase family protein [Fulvivirgaceae bacterium BMA10]